MHHRDKVGKIDGLITRLTLTKSLLLI